MVVFDRRTYPALIKLHPNERWAIFAAQLSRCKVLDWTRQMEVFLKRACEEPARTDGFRVLVDRLWPRGKKKADLRLNAWGNPEAKKAIADTVHAAQKYSAITLIYAAKDTEHNEAVVLQNLFKRKARA